MLNQLLSRLGGRVPEVTASGLEAELGSAERPVLLDIRSAQQFAAGHLPGAVHLPSDRLAEGAAELSPSAPTVVY